MPNLMKICPIGAEFFHADKQMNGRMDMTMLLNFLMPFFIYPTCNLSLPSDT